MRDTIFTRALLQAVQAQGSRQALASVLHVPENTLLRWMSGSAQTPLQAFRKVIDLLMEHERDNGAAGTAASERAAEPQALRFTLGDLLASCARCGGAEFALVPPGTTLKYATELRCRACNAGVTHGAVIAGLAKAAIYHTHKKRLFKS